MTNNFRARFFRKYADSERDWEVEETLVSFDRLKEQGKLKPPNTFNFKGISYLYVSEAITSYDRAGNPILKYFVGNMLPVVESGLIIQTKGEKFEFEIKKGLKETLIEGIKIVGDLFNRTFDRGEMKAVIASSQKEPQKFDWMSLVIGIAMGAMIGAFVMIFVYPSLFPTPHVVTSVTSSGASILAKFGFR